MGMITRPPGADYTGVINLKWNYQGDDFRGTIVGDDGQMYPYTVEDAQVRVLLPFTVDQARLRELLSGDGWAVALDHEQLDSQGWGPGYDVDGYYPNWVWPDAGQRGTILAFPPQDYRRDEAVRAGEDQQLRQPVFGPRSLDEFARWAGYVRAAAARH